MNALETFKAIVEEYLEQEGHSQAYFARKLKYKPDQFNKWLLGVNKIPYKVVCKICNALKLSHLQQVQMFALADYPLPEWVLELLSTAQSSPVLTPEVELAFAPEILGVYEGTSQEHEPDGEENSSQLGEENIERFSITNAKGLTRITGRSFHKTMNKKASTWNGRLWKVENDNTLHFIVELDTDSRELGTLIITCQHGEAEGWFYSGRGHRRLIYEFWARKVASL